MTGEESEEEGGRVREVSERGNGESEVRGEE